MGLVEPRRATSKVVLRRLDPQHLDPADRADWVELAGASHGTNVFAAPWLQSASLAHFDAARVARLYVVDAPGVGWIGAIALESARSIGRVPLPHLRNWSHANDFLGTPLVRVGCERLFWSHLLHGLDRQAGTGVALLCRSLPANDVVSLVLDEIATAECRPHSTIRSYERPAHRAAGSFEAYWQTAVSPRRRRRCASLASQLEAQVGRVEFVCAEPGEPIEAWLDAFLKLEAQGWKGREGSALAMHPATTGFFMAAAQAGQTAGTFRIARLVAGGRVIAMTTYFIEGGQGYGFKSAYDEQFARYAPGALLLAEVTRSLHAGDELFFDSCSAPGGEPAGSLWSGRRPLRDVALAIGPRPRQMVFTAAMQARAAWRGAKSVRAALGTRPLRR